MESKIEDENSQMIDANIIDKLLTEENQAFLTDYYINTLFKKDTVFTQGLTYPDFDIVLSSSDAEGQEIFHSLNICNCKYDPKSTATKKIIHFENLDKIMQNFLKWKEKKEKEYKEKPNIKDFPAIFMHAYPMVRKNLQIDISTITFKQVKKNDENKNAIVDFKIEQLKPDDKDIVYFVSFKLNQKQHKFGKIEQLLDQFKQEELKDFWNFYKKAYFIFCVEDEKLILSEYELFPEFLKKANEGDPHAQFIFYVDPPGESPDQVMNIFKMSEYEKDYYFMMGPSNVIERCDSMLCSGDVLENSIKRKKAEQSKKIKEEDINKALSTFYDFVSNIQKYKYNFFFGYQLEVCLKFNKEQNLILSYVNFSHFIAEVRTNEYKKLKECMDIFKPDIYELQEIETYDIPIDFNQNICIKCKKQIPDNAPMYYCYKCKEKYCTDCVLKNFNDQNNKGIKKFIDPKHNLLYFKTRNPENFKIIDKYKLGKDNFASCTDDSKLGNHSFSCNGCNVGQNYVKPRYLCLSCRPGLMQDNGFNDFCIDCIEHMNKNDEQGKKMQNDEYDLYGKETRFFYEDKTKAKHDHNEHIYLMIALEFKGNGDNGYYDY